jgi:DNA-binding GntR family transcriptional regulator
MALEQESGDGRPETLVSFASRRIKDALVSGAIEPGARLSPNKLATELGLSHIPVREALASLAAMGYVIHARGRGYFSRILSHEDLVDIYLWRDVLEREAYRLAVPKLTDEDIVEMTDLVEQMSHVLEPEDRTQYLALNREFHFVCFRRVGSRRLIRMLTYLWDSAQPYSTGDPTTSKISNAEHEQLLPLLDSRDADAVVEAMKSHRQIRIDQVARWETERAVGETGE